jgi:DNA (cytosine-5)-methyltransferase 1
MTVLKVLDLYSGMGGLSLGIALALRPTIMGIDININAVETYNLNLARYNARSIQADIFDWTPEKDYYDLVVGGSPCEPFSYANTRRRGESHPLFPTLKRFFDLVLELKPTAFIHENVKGLLSPRFRHHYEEQLKRIKEYYFVTYGVLNSADYGVPQKRERLFTIGIHQSMRKIPWLPVQSHAQRPTYTILGKEKPRWITLLEAIQDIMDTEKEVQPLSPRQVDQIKKRRQKAHDRGELPFPDSLDQPSRTISSDTIQGNKRETIIIMAGGLYRRLTIREAMRIQSFPDWWTFPPNTPMSTMQKLLGEAVPPILAYKIARSLAIDLGWEWYPPTKEDFKLPYFEQAFPELLAVTQY